MAAMGGYKPVAHQAPIVLTARLSTQKPTPDTEWNPEMRCYKHAQPGMLAFTDKKSTMPVYPEPEYFVNVKGFERNDVSFLGVVQTPAKHGPTDKRTGAGETNVVHAGGTITTFNTGKDEIPANSLVEFEIPKVQDDDRLPRPWRKTFDKKNCIYAVTKPAKEDTSLFVIGRAIRASRAGQQLDLILKY